MSTLPSSKMNPTDARIDFRRLMTLATQREAQVLALRAEGYSYGEISDMLPGKPHPDALRRRFFRFRAKVLRLMEESGR